MEGWVKLHRCITEKAAWRCTSSDTKAVMIALLTMVNHEKRKWLWAGKVIEIQPGQCVTSLDHLAEIACVSRYAASAALKTLEKLEFLEHRSTHHGTLITLANWAFYQAENPKSRTPFNTQLEHNSDTTQTQLKLNKNDKNVKNDKNDNKQLAVVSVEKDACILDRLSDEEYTKLTDMIPPGELVAITDEMDKQYTPQEVRKPYALILKVAKAKGVI